MNSHPIRLTISYSTNPLLSRRTQSPVPFMSRDSEVRNQVDSMRRGSRGSNGDSQCSREVKALAIVERESNSELRDGI